MYKLFYLYFEQNIILRLQYNALFLVIMMEQMMKIIQHFMTIFDI